MSENKFIKLSDLIEFIDNYSKTTQKLYRDDEEIKLVNFEDFKNKITNIKTYDLKK